MKGFLTFRTLPILAVAMILPVAAFAAGGTTQTAAKATTASKSTMHHDAAASAKPEHSHKDHAAMKAKHTMVDINTASKEELMALPGVTDAVAEKIIAGRPFKTKSELVAKQVLTRAEYGKLRGRISAKPGSEAAEHASKAPESTTPPTQTPESK